MVNPDTLADIYCPLHFIVITFMLIEGTLSSSSPDYPDGDSMVLLTEERGKWKSFQEGCTPGSFDEFEVDNVCVRSDVLPPSFLIFNA